MAFAQARPSPPWRVAVDVGGTFTDLVLIGANGAWLTEKTPSVPDDPSRGVIDALERAASELAMPVAEVLARTALFLHGSTVATNTVLEGRGARLGMLVTRGFRDFLEARRGARRDPFDHRTPYPPVLVPRYLRLPVGGRLDARGREVEPLAEDDVRAAADVLAREGVESVAICLLHSYADGAHERRAAEVLAGAWAGRWISLSHEVVPVIGEYERASTTVVNAYVAPKVTTYLRALAARLRELGLERELLVLQSNGRAASVERIGERAVSLVLSGPAGGVGALGWLARSTGVEDLLSMEIGGTSCDVMLAAGGRVPITDQLEVGDYDLEIASVDLNTVGAGGGTVAGVDAAGGLHVGPRGAGADPGPACYGRGGGEPTVTDAQLVLGRLAPGAYAGGTVTLDAGLAERALETAVARPLGISVREAAAGIVRVVEQHLVQAVEEVSSERGRDPSRFVLVAAGGAGPMHGAAVGRRLGVRAVLVPRAAGVFCALGMLDADVGQDFARVWIERLDESRWTMAEPVYGALEEEARTWLAAGGFAGPDMAFAREVDMRYAGQQWDVRVTGRFGDAASLRAAFEAEYERRFGHVQPGGTVEVTRLGVVGTGRLPDLPFTEAPPGTAAPEPATVREVWASPEAGFVPTPVYDGASLGAGTRLAGPLLVEEATTTVVVGPADTLEVLPGGDYRIAFDGTGAGADR